MGITVSRLWQHAVKSMQGQVVDEVVLGPGGLLGDRAYGFLDVETGRLVSAKHPKRYGAMLACTAEFVHPPRVDAPIPPVRVSFPDGSTIEGDVDQIAKHVSTLLGREVRMVTSVDPGVSYEEVWPVLEGFGPDALAEALTITKSDEAGEHIVGIPLGIGSPGTLLDLSPMHVLTTSTLRAMAAEHPAGQWDERRFRPNIVFDDDGATDGLAEDAWFGSDLLIGDSVRIHIVAPTPRCVMTTLAQPGLPHDSDILRTVAQTNNRSLGELGNFACAGAYAEVIVPGIVCTGDPVRVVERASPTSPLADAVAMLSEGLKAART